MHIQKHLELNGDGWPMPGHVCDVRHELRCMKALIAIGLRLDDIVLEA